MIAILFLAGIVVCLVVVVAVKKRNTRHDRALIDLQHTVQLPPLHIRRRI